MVFDSKQWAASILGCNRTEAEARLDAASNPKPLRSIEDYENGGAYRRLCMAAENGDKRARAALLDIERAFAENPPGPVMTVYSRDRDSSIRQPSFANTAAVSQTSEDYEP